MQEQNEIAYTKEQLIESKRYSNRKDLLRALLTDGESYTIKQTEQIIDEFMKGKVN